MKYFSEGLVLGVAQFEGVIDGEKIDSNSVFVQVDIDPKSGKGFRSVARKAESADVVKSVLHNTFPFEATFELTEMASKSKEQLVITKITPKRAVPKVA